MNPEENKKETISEAVQNSFNDGKEKGAKEAEKLLEALEEAKTNLEKVSLAAKLRGLATEIEMIDDKYAKQLEAVKSTAEKKREANEYASIQKDELGEKASKKIQVRSNKAVEKREKNANKALRVTTFFSKGMRLVGAQKISERIQDSMGNFAKRYVEKDSAVLRVTNSMIESGDLLRSDVQQVIDETNQKVGKFVESRKKAMENIDKSANERHKSLDTKANNRRVDERNERKAAIKDGRSARIHFGLEKSAKKLITARTNIAHGVVKLSTLSEKAARLVGAKGLAENMQKSSQSYAERLVTQDASIISFTKRMIKMGEVSKDSVTKAMKEARENIENRLNDAKNVDKVIKSKSQTLENKVAGKKHTEAKKEMKTAVYAEKILSRKDAEKIRSVKDKSIDRRLSIAQGFLKITGLPESVVRLVGSKETADKIANTSYKVAENLVKQDPTMTKFVVRMMKSGFIAKDQVKNGMNQFSEKVGKTKEKVVEEVGKIPGKIDKLGKDTKKQLENGVGKIKDGAENVILDIADVGEDAAHAIKNASMYAQAAIYDKSIDAGRAVKKKTLGIAKNTSRVAGVMAGFTGTMIGSATKPLREGMKDIGEDGRKVVGHSITSLGQKLVSLGERISSSHSKSQEELGLVAAKNAQEPERTQTQKDADDTFIIGG